MRVTLLWVLRIMITALLVTSIGNNEGWWMVPITDATWGRTLFGSLALLPWVVK